MTTNTLGLTLVIVLSVGACSSPPVVEQVPVGTDVQVVREDGAVMTGKLAARDEKTVQVDDGKRTREIPRAQIADVQVVEPSKPTPLPPVARFREYTVPAGTDLVVKLESSLASNTSRVEDAVEGTLAEPVVVDGTTIFPAGTRVRGEVTSAEPSGKVKGRASLGLRFGTIALDDQGNAYVIDNYAKALWKIDSAGQIAKLVQGEPFKSPVGLCRQGDRFLVADPHAKAVFSVTFDGMVTPVKLEP